MRLIAGSCCLAMLGLSSVTQQAYGETFEFHHENVLGTSLELQIDAEDASAAERAEAAALGEIERLSRIFSTYDSSSELSQWQDSGLGVRKLSNELATMLSQSERWHHRSQGAFNPAVESLCRVWRAAEMEQRVPDSHELTEAAQVIRSLPWKLNLETHEATRQREVPVTFNAIAKGAIVDEACRVSLAVPGVTGVLVNIGGDLRAAGTVSTAVSVTDPFQSAVNAPPLTRVFLSDAAVATSGSYHRGYRIQDRWYSHIIDPRTGRPVEHVASATVVAESSRDADALATILNVLPIDQGLALVEATPGAACLIVAADRSQHPSAAWPGLQQPGLFRFAAKQTSLLAESKAAARLEIAAADDATKTGKEKTGKENRATDQPAPTAELLELLVKFELNRPAEGRYRRPYVAIWLEDKDEFPVRTAVLWMQTKQPGPRWHRDLLRWFKNDQIRKLADGTDLIGTVSSATRNAGQYQAVFDGLDDAGKPLPKGDYTLFIEVAREHGTYQLIRHKLALSDKPIAETKLKENVEVKSATVEYRAHTTPADRASTERNEKQ